MKEDCCSVQGGREGERHYQATLFKIKIKISSSKILAVLILHHQTM